MNELQVNPHVALLPGVSQFEVDFVIPKAGVDVPLGIDPFLLYKSRDAEYAALHTSLVDVFNAGIEAVKTGDSETSRYLFDFPEPSEIGLGYTAKGKRGAGVGSFLTELLIETLQDSSALVERGVKHIEEMQLVSVGIGPDRVSDIAANLIKQFLISYTQKQCGIWNIPIKSGVPIHHIFDLERYEWYDDYVDLPVSPIDSTPILLVPRRFVRVLPWINYDDYFRMEFSAYLRKKKVRSALQARDQSNSAARPDKQLVVGTTRQEIERLERYVQAKEDAAELAQPSLSYLNLSDSCPEAARLNDRLAKIQIGRTDAALYQRTILEILNYLFSPELIDGETEVATYEGTERRDIIFTNDSDKSFWTYLRTEHSSILLMFETKNTQGVEISHLNQTATYLGDRLGRLGFIATRRPASLNEHRKAFAIHNDSNPRKLILILSDDDFYQMLDMKCKGIDPMRYLQQVYRKFRQTVQ